MQMYLALLGFLPHTKSKLQSTIEKHLSTKISWVSATDEQLQGIVINASFISSPMVQNYVKRSTVNIVCCHSDEDGKQQALESEIHSLHHLQHSIQELKYWLTILSGNASLVTFTEAELSSQPKTNIKKNIPATLKSSSENIITTNFKEKMSDNYDKLLSSIGKQSGYYLVQYGNDAVWVNADKKQVYFSFPRKNIQPIEKSRWKPLTEFTPPNDTRSLQLDLWLFETLWQSSEEKLANKVDTNGLYQLISWPRPLCTNGRSEALRLAAFIQKPITIPLLCKQTHYGETVVKRFLYAGLLSGQIKQAELATGQKKYGIEKKKLDTEKVSLLNRIRSKFGL